VCCFDFFFFRPKTVTLFYDLLQQKCGCFPCSVVAGRLAGFVWGTVRSVRCPSAPFRAIGIPSPTAFIVDFFPLPPRSGETWVIPGSPFLSFDLPWFFLPCFHFPDEPPPPYDFPFPLSVRPPARFFFLRPTLPRAFRSAPLLEGPVAVTSIISPGCCLSAVKGDVF